MGLPGSQFLAYRNNAYLQMVTNNVFTNSWILDQNMFEVIMPEQCPGGPALYFNIDYSQTTNAASFTIGSPMPDADTTNTVAAYFNKDYFQGSAKTYNILKNQMLVNYNGMTVDIDPDEKAIEDASKNLIDVVSTTAIADLSTQIDSTTAFGDGSLTRADYGIASYESAVGGAQTLLLLEDGIEYLEDVTYGPVPHDDLVILMPRNQLTNHSRLVAGAAYREMNASSQNRAPIDGGSQSLVSSFDGVPIVVVPDMTTTEILIVQKSAVKVFVHMALGVVYKPQAAAEDAWHLTMGVNVVYTNPRSGVKYTGVTV